MRRKLVYETDPTKRRLAAYRALYDLDSPGYINLERVQAVMLAVGLSYEQLGKMRGVSKQAIGFWLGHIETLKLTDVVWLAEVLGLNLEELVWGIKKNSPETL